MSKCCAYQPSRSPAGIFFGYHRSTKPGSDQLAVPTRIFPLTHQRSRSDRESKPDCIFQMNSRRTNVFRFAQHPHRTYFRRAGWSSLVARQAHNLKVAGSNPAPATKFSEPRWSIAFTLSRTRRESFTSVCPTMSREESNNTTAANHAGQRDAAL